MDGVSGSLRLGDFHLVVAGDGIRSDLHAVADHLKSGLSRLSFLEVQLWADQQGRTLVVPSVPLRTEVLRQRVVVDRSGMPLELEEHAEDTTEVEEAVARWTVDPEQAQRRSQDRTFWHRFVEAAAFDHPDQTPPRHGGHNWVKISLPAPAGWMTAYRNKTDIGLLMPLKGEDGRALFERLEIELPELKADSGLDLTSSATAHDPFEGEISVKRDRASFANEDEQLGWVVDAANRFVTMIRPQLTLADDTTDL